MTPAGEDGAQLAVVSQSGCTLSFFDVPSGRHTTTLPVTAEPHEVRFDPGRRRLYVSHTYRSGFFARHDEKGHEITVVDLDARRVVRVIDVAPEHAPHALAVDRANGLLHVSVEEGPQGPGGLISLDPDTGTVVARASAEAPVPHWAVVSPDGTTAYTTNKTTPYVSVVDLTGRAPVGRIPVAGSEEITLSPDGGLLYIATPTTATDGDPAQGYAVQVVETSTLRQVMSLPVPAAPSAVHVTATGRLLAGCWPLLEGRHPIPYGAGILSVLDAVTGEHLAEVPVGVCPINVTSTPDGRLAYVANLISGTVSVVDLDTHDLRADIVVDARRADGDLARGTHNQGAHGVAYVPARA